MIHLELLKMEKAFSNLKRKQWKEKRKKKETGGIYLMI